MVNSPNELQWRDGLLWEDRIPPIKWFDDGSAQGLYNTHYPPHHRIRLNDFYERRADRAEAKKLVQDFGDKLAPGETSLTLIDAQMARRAKKRYLPRMVWVQEIPHAPPFREFPKLRWWQELHFLSFKQRQELDHHIALEVERGEWD